MRKVPVQFSPTSGASGDADDDARTWKPLRFLNFYRFTLATIFTIILLLGTKPSYIGSYHPALALVTALVYLVFSTASEVFIRRRWPHFAFQAYLQIGADVVAVMLMMHASGGTSSGVGMLLVVAIAGSSILLAGKTANFIAAIATFATFFEELYAQLTQSFTPNYTQAGLLGATFFATAALAYVLAKRIKESEALAAQRGIDLANLAQLNEHVLQRMQSGIVVVDAENRVRMMNESAWHMLGMPTLRELQPLGMVSQALADQVKSWRSNNAFEPLIFRASSTGASLLPRFTRLGSAQAPGVLIYLEDTSVMAQQAQQMKLASLGRLTASIAHEIRNPLGAISHAGQLLSESPHLDQSDRRLTEIIQNHSKRMNAIIENVLQLSRRERSSPQHILLRTWLEQFVVEFLQSRGVDASTIAVDITPPDVSIHVDPIQLQQVLTNLCENGLRHGANHTGFPKLELRGGVTRDSGGAFLDVIDHGPGINPETAQHIFEPFFTTEPTGSGLGLYIARELCEVNRARLNYIPVPSGGSCFRINFPEFNRGTTP